MDLNEKDGMDPAWIGAISALLGVAVGTTAEAIRSRLAFQRDKQWEAIEERRRRLELIYEAVVQVGESYSSSAMPIVMEMTMGARTSREVDSGNVPWAPLRMLVNLYWPSLLPYLEEVEEAGPRVGVSMGKAVMEASGDRSHDAILGDSIMKELDRLSLATTKMKEAIVNESRSIDVRASSLMGIGSLKP